MSVVSTQSKRMLALLKIAYDLQKLGYDDVATNVFYHAASEGEAGLKGAARSRKPRQAQFTALAEATTRAWKETRNADRLEAFNEWLAANTPVFSK